MMMMVVMMMVTGEEAIRQRMVRRWTEWLLFNTGCWLIR
jgi:hypothetical protein